MIFIKFKLLVSYLNDPFFQNYLPVLNTFILESNSSDLTKHMFNETCCLEKGVPQECIGNCQGARNSGMGLRMGLLQTRCTRFEKTINGCIVNLSDGN